MPTPDASQFTQLKKYTAVSNTPVTTRKPVPYRFYVAPPSFLSNQSLFLPSITKYNKFALTSLSPQEQLPGYAGALQFTNSATPSYLQVTSKPSLFPGTQDFTISFFLYLSSTGGSSPRVFSLRYPRKTGTGAYAAEEIISLFFNKSANSLGLNLSNNTVISVPNYNLNLDSWHFVNIYGISGTSINIEVDGVFKGTRAGAYNIANTNNRSNCVLDIGSYADSTQLNMSLKGSLANFRWVVGSGLSITPKPSPPLPVISGKTSLLLLANSQASAFTDSGDDNANTTITVVGPSIPSWSNQLVI